MKFHATPYDITATGFYFETFEAYEERAAAHTNEHGDPVEEYEIQFIDGEIYEAVICEALGINQANLEDVINYVEGLDDHDAIKAEAAAALGILDLSTDLDDIEIYECDSLKELAEQFVDEGLFGDIPENLANYIDYEAIGRDLGIDGYSIETLSGKTYAVRAM